jgi:hypothetical protein
MPTMTYAEIAETLKRPAKAIRVNAAEALGS